MIGNQSSRWRDALLMLVLIQLGSTGIARANALSYSGTLADAEDFFQTTVTLLSAGTLTLQTWEFGGGINASGMDIAPGGFDPLVAVFAGTGSGASLVNGTSDGLSNYGSFSGCPPAGTVNIGSFSGQCGDITMSLTALPAGTYTVILSDAEYIPNALFDNGTFGEGFTDLTGGSLPFQTCVDQNNCIIDTANWALDITGASGTPEPATWGTAILSLAMMALVRRTTKSRKEDSKNEFS